MKHSAFPPGRDYPVPMIDHVAAKRINGVRLAQVYKTINLRDVRKALKDSSKQIRPATLKSVLEKIASKAEEVQGKINGC